MNTQEFEIKWDWMDKEEEAMVDAMYEEWLASQEFGGEPEGDSLYW